jgi:broad specificity phosphatase PhoE
VKVSFLRLALAGVLLIVAGVAEAAPAIVDTAVTTVLVVRHAEKNPHPPGGDAGLSTKGLVRAQELVRAVGDAEVQAVYVSQYGRTRLTGEPLARARGDSVRVYDANRNDLLAARLRADHRGQTVLVVGHGDSVPELLQALTGEPLPQGEAVGYDRLYVLTLGPGKAHRLVRLRYGSPAE